ncbi:MAG: efflux RND transporter periplasmic adaptor subunit [Bryobacteraceae bacterium]
MSKDVKPKQRLGQKRSLKKTLAGWVTALVVFGGAGYAAYRYTGTTEVDVPVARVRKAEFVISVRTRGEIRSTRSVVLAAPQVPDPRIVTLAESGRAIKKGDVVVEFDAEQQRQNFIERDTTVRTADSEIVQTKASHTIVKEMDNMSRMQAEYNVERSKLEASKAEIVSEIEGAKNRIQVGVAEGELRQVETSITSRGISQEADLDRLNQRKEKTVRDRDLAQGYMSKMVIRAPNDGIVNILPNFRTQGSFGQALPPFKEGDRVWTGAAIAEIPDLSEMRIELKLEEVDRGKLKLGQMVRIRVDAVPDKEFMAELDWISPIAALIFKGFMGADKVFPARATLKNLDGRLRPGMSASAELIVERHANALIIPARASIIHNGKPAVYIQRGESFTIRPITVGQRNEEDLVVLSGLREGELVTLERPTDAAKRAKKKL